MKILGFKNFINESNEVDNSVSISGVVQVLDQIEKMGDMLKDEEFMEDYEDQISKADIPKVIKDTIRCSLLLMKNDEFRENMKNQLEYTLKLLKDGKNTEEITKNSELIKNREKLDVLGTKILNISKEEMEKLSQQFYGGIKKYKEEKEKSRQFTIENPYGEEDWGGKSEEEMMKKRFGE